MSGRGPPAAAGRGTARGGSRDRRATAVPRIEGPHIEDPSAGRRARAAGVPGLEGAEDGAPGHGGPDDDGGRHRLVGRSQPAGVNHGHDAAPGQRPRLGDEARARREHGRAARGDQVDTAVPPPVGVRRREEAPGDAPGAPRPGVPRRRARRAATRRTRWRSPGAAAGRAGRQVPPRQPQPQSQPRRRGTRRSSSAPAGAGRGSARRAGAGSSHSWDAARARSAPVVPDRPAEQGNPGAVSRSEPVGAPAYTPSQRLASGGSTSRAPTSPHSSSAASCAPSLAAERSRAGTRDRSWTGHQGAGPTGPAQEPHAGPFADLPRDRGVRPPWPSSP